MTRRRPMGRTRPGASDEQAGLSGSLRCRCSALTARAMATTTLEIPRELRRSYFDELTDALGTVEATVEVVGRDVGAQIEAERPSPTTTGPPRSSWVSTSRARPRSGPS